METEKLVTHTWLPVFPGFYCTVFDTDYLSDYKIDYIRETYEPAELAECMVENLYNSEASTKFYREYQQSIAKQCVDIIWDNLKRLKYIDNIEFEELISPREYNFTNDSININIKKKKNDENRANIKIMIQEHADEWKEYLIKNYKSRSGFISHHSYYPEDDKWNIDTALQDKHNAGSILQFICEQNDITDETLYAFVTDKVNLDIKMLKKECIDKGWYVPKNVCRDWFRSIWMRFNKNYRFYRYVTLFYPDQYVFETPKQKYIFVVFKGELNSKNYITKRYLGRFIFAKLKEEKKHGNKNNN